MSKEAKKYIKDTITFLREEGVEEYLLQIIALRLESLYIMGTNEQLKKQLKGSTL